MVILYSYVSLPEGTVKTLQTSQHVFRTASTVYLYAITHRQHTYPMQSLSPVSTIILYCTFAIDGTTTQSNQPIYSTSSTKHTFWIKCSHTKIYPIHPPD
jgi:hypothetical protein